jgi:hypothetical protein
MKQLMVGINPHHHVLLIVKLRGADEMENVNETERTENSKPDIIGLSNLIVDCSLSNARNMITEDTRVIMNMLINMNGTNIKFVNNPTEEQCFMALDYSGMNIQYIKNPTKKMWLHAVADNGSSIVYLKPGSFDPSDTFMIFKTAINSNNAVEVIKEASKHFDPHDELYKELCKIAVAKNRHAIENVIEPSEELCLSVIEYDSKYFTYVNNPSEEFYRQAIIKNPYTIKYIPQTYERCLLAVQQKMYDVTKFIEKEFITEELCYEAIKANPYIPLYKLPEKSFRICEEASKVDKLAWINDLSEDEQTDEICELFIKNCPTCFWPTRRYRIKNKSRKVKWMKLLKSLGFWKVK